MLFDDWLTISKSHRYSRKEFKNGTWTDYYYDKDANFSRMTQCKGKTLKINASMTEEAIVSIAENYIKNVWIADWKAHPAKAICKELKGKKIFFKDISYEHLKKTGKNSLVGKGNRNKQNLLKHVKYLPCAKELLESNGVHTQSRYQQFSSPRKDGAVGIVYQTLSGIAPAGDNNNYVQVVVSRKKYKDGTLSDMVCISVFGSKDIKKGTDSDFKIKKSLFDNRDFGNSLACPIVDTETVPITTYSLPHNTAVVNKSVADRVRAILSGGGCSQNILGKAGLPVGTISGSYKKISDNPSQWEYVTQEHVFDTAGNNDRRAYLANKARLITNVQELPCTTKNYKTVGTSYLYKMRDDVFAREVVCKANGKRVVDVNTRHIFKDKNTDENKALRVRALPFVLPIIERYGEKGIVTKRPDGIFTEVVGKADITVKGMKKRCAISVVLVTNNKDRQALTQLSVFVVENKVIKSLATDAPRTSRSVRSGLNNPCASDSHFSARNNNLPHNSSIVNKSVEISIVDITEGNKEEKLVQFAKVLDCLSQGKRPRIKRIKADATEQLPNIIIHFRRVDKNSIVKALNGTAMVLKSSVPAKGEEFTYQCHKDMMEGINRDLASLAHKTYSFVQSYFGLPEITTMSKADMRWKGKLIYSPETGRPITQNEWKVFVDALERFMNRNYSGLGERWVLSAEAMGRLLDRMVKYQSLDSVRSTPLKGMKYGTKTYDWISDSVKNLRTTMGESLTRTQQARLEVARQSAAQRVANVKDATRNKMQQIIIDGVRDRKSKSQVSQALFDSCASMNRDMQRIADSEYQMAMDRAYIAEEVYNSTDGEKLYFQRFEMLDEHTCKKCQRLKGKIAVWSETPLPDEKVRDEYASYAIWEGKVDGDAPVDILHPWCRGSWVRWTPPAQTRHTDAYAAYMSGLNGAWDKAVKAAREEWERKGVANPTDKTPGYVDRCRELFQIFSNK